MLRFRSFERPSPWTTLKPLRLALAQYSSKVVSYPLSIITWNVNQFKNARFYDATKQIQLLTSTLQEVIDLDFILLQESNRLVSEHIEENTDFRLIEDAQAMTYRGCLQAFRSQASRWVARIAWQYTCLTFDISWETESGNKQPTDSLSPVPSTPPFEIVRISNIHLDSPDRTLKTNEKAMIYLRRVPQADIIVGDGQFRKNSAEMTSYQDAFELAGRPPQARFTQDTYENKYYPDLKTPFYARTTRLYLRGTSPQTPIEKTSHGLCATEISKEDIVDPDAIFQVRRRFSYTVDEMRVFKPWLQENPVKIGISGHYGLLTRLQVHI